MNEKQETKGIDIVCVDYKAYELDVSRINKRSYISMYESLFIGVKVVRLELDNVKNRIVVYRVLS